MTDESDKKTPSPVGLEGWISRMDERTGQILKELADMKAINVTRVEFEAKLAPIRLLVYGFTSLLLIAIVTLLIINSIRS